MGTIVVSLFLFLAFLIPPAYAGELFCFDQDNAARLLIEVEQCRVKDEIITALESRSGAQAAEIAAHAKKDEQQALQLQGCETALDEVRQLAKNMGTECDAAIKKAVKEARPSLFEAIGKAAVFLIIGIGVGLAL